MILAQNRKQQRQARSRRRGLPGPRRDGPFCERKTLAEEMAYRRGFGQAAWFAFCAMRGGATVAQVEAWAAEVDDWRSEDRDRVVWPPLPPRMKTSAA